jgi:hypothetical protein
MTERLDPYELFADDEWEIEVKGSARKTISKARRHVNRSRASSEVPRAPREDERAA